MNYLTVRRPNTVRRPTNGVSTWNDFDRLFESVFGNLPGWNDRAPAVDIRQNEHMYIIEADLPGMNENQIDVRVENDLLVLSATVEEEKSGETKTEDSDEFIVRERFARSFYRSFAMPKDADAGQIEATYRNGVLTVQLHKKPESKPRQIEIKRG
ncbi:MAG: Hsp20/alpha crystallin family protein [Alkalispirochaeta sp.]